jgi:hypothetical protein
MARRRRIQDGLTTRPVAWNAEGTPNSPRHTPRIRSTDTALNRSAAGDCRQQLH